MVTPLNEQLDEIVRLRQADPAQILTEALRAGMQQVYLDAILDAYLHGKISRPEAVERLGGPTILRVEEERRVVHEDVSWGMRA